MGRGTDAPGTTGVAFHTRQTHAPGGAADVSVRNAPRWMFVPCITDGARGAVATIARIVTARTGVTTKGRGRRMRRRRSGCD